MDDNTSIFPQLNTTDNGGVMTPAQVQEFRINHLARLGGGEDWAGYQKQSEETGIPAINFALRKEKRNVNNVRVPQKAMTDEAAKTIAKMPDATAVQCGTDVATLTLINDYEKRCAAYDKILKAQNPDYKGGYLPKAGDITRENEGEVTQRLAYLFQHTENMDGATANVKAREYVELLQHKPTPAEQTRLDDAYARLRSGEDIDKILEEDAFRSSLPLRRRLELYASHQRNAAIAAHTVLQKIYGDKWEEADDKQKSLLYGALCQQYPGLEWLKDVPLNMLNNKTILGGDLKIEGIANWLGLVDISNAVKEYRHPFDTRSPLLADNKRNRYYQDKAINAMRPSGLGYDILQGTINTVAFMESIYTGGMAAAGTKAATKITLKNVAPELAKTFGVNAWHALKGGKYGTYWINTLLSGAGEVLSQAATPVAIADPVSGAKLELTDGDVNDLFNNMCLAFGRRHISQAVSVGVEGLGEVIDNFIKFPLEVKKKILKGIFGQASPKIMARTADILKRGGVDGFTGELMEEWVEDMLQPAKDVLFEKTGLDVLSEHQRPQFFKAPLRWTLTTGGVLALLRAPFSAVATATVLSDYTRGKIEVEKILEDAGVGEQSQPTDKDQSAVSGQAQRAWRKWTDRVVFVPQAGVEVALSEHQDTAEQVKTIIHDDGTGTLTVSAYEAGELMRNHPETKDAVKAVLECATGAKKQVHEMTKEDVQTLVELAESRTTFVSDIAIAVQNAIDSIPDTALKRKVSGGSNYATAQMIAGFANMLLGKDYEMLPPDAKEVRRESALNTIKQLTIAGVNSDDLGTPVEDIKGINIETAYNNRVALRSASAEFCRTTGMDMSPTVMSAAEAAVALKEAGENSADQETAFFNRYVTMMRTRLEDASELRVGDVTIRVKRVDGEGENAGGDYYHIEMESPHDMLANQDGTPMQTTTRIAEGLTRASAIDEAITNQDLYNGIKDRMIKAAEATKKWRAAVNEDCYKALEEDAAVLANGDNITIRNEGRQLDLSATAPVYRELLRAVVMMQAGKSTEEIYKHTMWLGNADGNWTFTLPAIEVSDEVVDKFCNGTPVTLGEVIGSESPLFRIHPEMAEQVIPTSSMQQRESDIASVDSDSIKAKAVGARDGNATDSNALAALIYEYAGDVLEKEEGLPDGTIPRVMPDANVISGEWLRDAINGGEMGIFNRAEIDKTLIRTFAIPKEHQVNPAEYVLRLANEQGGIDAVIDNGVANLRTHTGGLKGLTTFAEDRDAAGINGVYSTLIMLFKGADGSTMVHELGHWMWRELRAFVKHGAATKDLVAMVESIDNDLNNYARAKGAVEGTNEWESIKHEAFSDAFVKYLMTSDADILQAGALSTVRKQLEKTYQYLGANPNIELSDSLTSFFDSYIAAERMFDDGEAPLSELNADTLKQLFAAAGILDNADGVIAKLMEMLDIARDSQTTLAAREMENSIDWQQVDAEASRAYDESDFAKLATALNKLGGIPVNAIMEALPDTIVGEQRAAIKRALHDMAKKHGWLFTNPVTRQLAKEARTAEQQAQQAVEQSQARLNEYDARINTLESQLADVRAEYAATVDELATVEADLQTVTDKRNALTAQGQELYEQIGVLTAERKKQQKAHKTTAPLTEQLADLQAQADALIAERADCDSTLERLTKRSAGLIAKREKIVADNRAEEIEADIMQARADYTTEQERLASLQAALKNAHQQAADVARGIRGITASIKSSSQKYADEVGKIMGLAQHIKDNPTEAGSKNYVLLQMVTPNEAKRIKEATGHDVTEYIHVIDDGILRKFNRQANDKVFQANHNLISPSTDEYALIPLVIHEFDSVENTIIHDNMNVSTILYKKKIGDTYYVVEEVRPGGGKRKRLAIRRFYKDVPPTQDALPRKVASSRSTSETGGGDVANTISTDGKSASDESRPIRDVSMMLSSALDVKYPGWRNQETSTGRHSTQIRGTESTYRKVGAWLEKTMGADNAHKLQILDASSGLGYGTLALREKGFNVDDVEPFPGQERLKDRPPTFQSYDSIDKQYDFVISNAVLNVIPDDWRDGVIADMARHTKVGGRMFINVRSDAEIRAIKTGISLDSDNEKLIPGSKPGTFRSYQRGWSLSEFENYMREKLGDGWKIERVPKDMGGATALLVTKLKPSPVRDVSLSKIVYTGSAADYDQPSLEFVGTGEGMQAQGFGLYATEARNVAGWYALADRERKNAVYGHIYKQVFWPNKNEVLLDWDKPITGEAYKRIRKAFFVDKKKLKEINHTLSEYDSLMRRRKEVFTDAFGREHDPISDAFAFDIAREVHGETRDSIERLDNRIKELHQQYRKEIVQRAFATEGAIHILKSLRGNTPHFYGAIAHTLNSPALASKVLYEAGIDGITYIGKSSGERNYVAFNDADIMVLEHTPNVWRDEFGFEKERQARLAKDDVIRKVLTLYRRYTARGEKGETFAKSWPQVTWHFVYSYDELSDSLKARPDSAYMEGCVDEQGEIWIRLDMVAPERLEAVCLHELIGHLGLENLLGEKFHPFIDEFYRQHKNDALADTIRQRYGIDDANGDINAKRLLAREMLANIAETPGAKPTFWQKVIDTIRELLRAIGFELKWNQRDLDRLFAKDEAFLRNSTLNEIKANLAEANGFSAQNDFSLHHFTDGTPYVLVDTDQHIFDGQPGSQYRSIARKYILKHFRGKVIGDKIRAFVDRDSPSEYAYPAAKLDDEMAANKMRAAPELDNLVKAARAPQVVPDDGHHPDVKEWEHSDVLFQVGGRLFAGRINIVIKERGRVFHDVTQIEDVTDKLKSATAGSMAQYGNSARPHPYGDVSFSLTPEKDFASQQAESLAQMERDDQMQALRKAMDSGELPAHTFEELVNAILNFQTKSEFIKKFKAERRKQIYANPDMRIKMKTLDSDKLNAVFEHLSTIFKQYAPHYTYDRRRQINVARAMQLIGESTVNAVMHNRVDADGNYGNILLDRSIRNEAKNIVMSLFEVLKHGDEKRADGTPTNLAERRKAQSVLALESLNRINQFIAVARRINRAQAMVTNFIKELRVTTISKQRERIDSEAFNALREIQLAVTHNGNIQLDANPQARTIGNWRRRFVATMRAMADEAGVEPREWSELCFQDSIDLRKLTINQAQELSDFFKYIKHCGRVMSDQTRLDNKEHIRDTIRKIEADLTPEAEKNNYHALKTGEEGGSGLWEFLKSVARSWDAQSTSAWRFLTEHGDGLNGIYKLLTEMKTDEDSLRGLVYDGENNSGGLNKLLREIEELARVKNVDVSSLDHSAVAFTGNDDTHAYRNWTLPEVIMATLYLGTDSGRQRLRRTINTDKNLREPDLVAMYPDAVLEQIPAVLPPEILEKINGIWGTLERLNTRVRDTYRKQNGYELELLDPLPFSVNGVQMTGGYAPIAYRYSAAAYKPVTQDKVGDAKGTDMDLFERGRAYTPQTQAVHQRLAHLFGHPPLALTLKTLVRYTDEASHYATHALGMQFVLKVMRSKEVKNIFERAYGEEAYKALEATLLQISSPGKYLDRANAIEKYFKGTVVANALWGNLSSVLKQFASVTVGASELGMANILTAMADFLIHPRKMVEYVRNASAYMRNRQNMIDDNIARSIDNLTATKGEKIMNRVQWLGYAPMGYCDGVVSGILFTAAYRKAVTDGKTPMEGKAQAEDFVKRTQGSAETLYNPQLKNSWFGRSITMFMTAALAQYNMLRHDIASASKKGIASTVLSVTYDMIVPAVICGLITILLTPGGDDDDDEQTAFENRVAKGRDEFLSNLWGGIPYANFVGDAYLTMMSTDFNGGKMNRMEYLSPLSDAINSLGRAGRYAANGELLSAAINLGNALSIPANMPIIKLGERFAKYADALHITDPETEPWTLRKYNREIDKEIKNND